MDCYGGQQSDDKQWGIQTSSNGVVTLPLAYRKVHFTAYAICIGNNWACMNALTLTTLQPLGRDSCYWLSIGIQTQWGLASTSRAWATENKYPISFRIATFAISLIPRNPAENSMYTEQVGIKLCTKTGFYGGLHYIPTAIHQHLGKSSRYLVNPLMFKSFGDNWSGPNSQPQDVSNTIPQKKYL